MTSTILTNSFRFPPPFTAPNINFNGDDVGITRGQVSPDPAPLTMPTNPIGEGDQIVVILNYFQGLAHTPPAPPRCSDNITGTVGWANTFYSGDSGSDHFMDFHVKTAVGGETSIDYDLPATTDLIAYVIRLNPEDHIEFSSGATPSATINSTTLPSVEGVTATADASLAWFLAANNNVDGAVLSNPGNYVLEVSQDDGDSIPTTGLTIWSQYINSENVTNTTDVTFDTSEGIRAHQIALSRKATWDTPVIEGHQFSSGTAGIADTFSPTNPAGMQVGDLLIHYYIANNDVDTTPTWNGDTAAWWNPICNIANAAGQDWRVTMGWRIWDGTEPAWSILINTFGFSASVQCVMFRVTGHNPAAPIQQPFALSIGNTGVTSYDIPVMNCAPNALSFINVTTWGSPTITTPPAGLDVYPSPTSTAQIFTGANEGQEPDPFGTVIWDPYNPAIGFVGFHIVGNPTYPAYTEFPLIENFISLDQEVTDWENGETWNNFWGWGWKPDGTKFVTINNSNDRFYGFDFSTPFDFTTTSNNSANPGQSVSVVGLGMMFNEDGTKYSTWSWWTGQNLITYNAATPYEPKTTDTQIGTISLSAYSSSTMESYWIDRSGKHLFIATVGNSPDKILHFKMTTPWDASTAVLQSDEFNVTVELPGVSPGRLYMSPSGRDMMFSNNNSGSGINHLRMSIPYNLNTAGLVSTLSHGGPRGGGIWMTDDGTKLITGPGANDSYDIQVRTIPTGPTITPPQAANLNIWLDAGEPASYDGSGSTWYDLSSKRNHALWARGAAECQAMYTSGTNGYFDLDVGATTSNRVFTIADDITIRPDGADPWTVSYLVAPSDVSTISQDYLAFKGNQFSMLYQYYSAGRFSPFLNASPNWNDTFDEYFADEIDGWYLVTARSTGSVIDGNVNGNWNTDAVNGAPTIGSTVGTPWYIGGTNTSSALLFPGAVAGVWFWQGVALSDVEVAEHVTNMSNRYTLSNTYKP